MCRPLSCPSLALLWDRTKGGIGVKGVGNLVDGNLWLNTRNPNIKSIRDLTEKDRIAVPGIKTSYSAIALQMCVAKIFGFPQHSYGLSTPKKSEQTVCFKSSDSIG